MTARSWSPSPTTARAWSPTARAVLFEPGARTADVNGHRGAGLGLPLARRLAKAIGGDVTLAPQAPGAGAQFEVRLPA